MHLDLAAKVETEVGKLVDASVVTKNLNNK